MSTMTIDTFLETLSLNIPPLSDEEMDARTDHDLWVVNTPDDLWARLAPAADEDQVRAELVAMYGADNIGCHSLLRLGDLGTLPTRVLLLSEGAHEGLAIEAPEGVMPFAGILFFGGPDHLQVMEVVK